MIPTALTQMKNALILFHHLMEIRGTHKTDKVSLHKKESTTMASQNKDPSYKRNNLKETMSQAHLSAKQHRNFGCRSKFALTMSMRLSQMQNDNREKLIQKFERLRSVLMAMQWTLRPSTLCAFKTKMKMKRLAKMRGLVGQHAQ